VSASGSSSKLFSNTVWLAGGRVVSDALAFVLFILVARHFGASGIGVYSFNFALAAILYELITLGVEEYGVREFARHPAARAVLIRSLLGAQLLITAVALILLAALAASGVLREADLPLLAFMVVYQVGSAIARTLFIPAFVHGNVVIQTASEVASRLATLLLALAVVYAGPASLTSTLIGLPIFGLVLLFVAAFTAMRFGSPIAPGFARDMILRALREIWPFAAAGLLFGLYSRTAVLVIFMLLGSAAAGLFASAFKFAEVGWLVLLMLPAASYPHLSRLFHADPAHFRSLSSEVLRAVLVGGALIAWGIYWVVPVLVGPLLGAEFVAAIPALHGMAGFMLVLAPCVVLARLMLVADLQRTRLRIAALQTVLNLALTLMLVPHLDVRGAVVAFVVTQSLIGVQYLYALRAHLDMRDVLRSMLVFSLAVVCAVLAAALLAHQAFGTWTAPLGSLVALLLVAHLGGLLRSVQFLRGSNGESWARYSD
jgi:O-antigen/teichoic acid export membrane protein